MKVVALTRSFFPKEGGAERQLRSVLGELSAAGHKVTVITSSAPGMKTREDLNGIRVLRVGRNATLSSLAQLSFFLGATVRAIFLKADVYVSLQMGAASVAAAIGARANRRRHVLRLTGGGSEKFRSEPIAKGASRRGRILASFFDRDQTTVVAPARHLLADYVEAFPSSRARTSYMPNGIPSYESQFPKDSDVVWYSRDVANNSANIFLCLVERLRDIQFTVIGNSIDVKGAVNVTQLGWVDTPERVMGRHRVLINTSVREGMPNTILQALSLGCNIVAFDNAGTREVRDRFPDRVVLIRYGEVGDFAEATRASLLRRAEGPVAIESLSEVSVLWERLITSGST